MTRAFSPLPIRYQRPAFDVDATTYTWLDVFLFAMLADSWRTFERELAEGLACAAEADAADSWPDDDRVEAAANAFRQERDLLAASEMLAWLATQDLTAESWMDGMARRLLREDRRRQLDDLLNRHPGRFPPPAEALAAEGICGGHFARMVMALAERVAVATASSPEAFSGDGDPAAVDRVRAAYGSWLEALGEADIAQRLDALAALDRQYVAAMRARITDETLAALVARNQLEWTRIDLERVSFASLDAAREAVLSVRVDGLSLTEVARDAHETVTDTRAVLDDLDPDLADAVLAAAVDDVVGPVGIGSRFEVVCVVSKAPPDLADAIVRARAERASAKGLIDRSVAAHVRWPAEGRI